jgi:hypothetical protein
MNNRELTIIALVILGLGLCASAIGYGMYFWLK